MIIFDQIPQRNTGVKKTIPTDEGRGVEPSLPQLRSPLSSKDLKFYPGFIQHGEIQSKH